MARACDEWFDKLEEMVNARLAELNPVDGRDAISKCQVYMDFDKVDQFSKFKGGRFTQDERNKDKAWDKSQIKAEYDKVERFADRNDNEKCEQAISNLTDENINNLVNDYFAQINVASQGVPPGCDEDVATAQAKAAQEKAEEEVLVRKRKCPYGTPSARSNTQDCRDLAQAEADLKRRADAVATATLESLSGRDQNVNFKEQCFLLGEIYGISLKKEQLDEFIDPSNLKPPLKPKSAWRKELKPLPYPNGINKGGCMRS